MTPERWQQIKSVFDELVEHAPEDRDLWLRECCGNDEDLRSEVLSLAQSDMTTDIDFLNLSLVEGAPADCFTSSSLGSYRLLQPIGRGGMGCVYLALREEDQFRRHVAVKAIRPS